MVRVPYGSVPYAMRASDWTLWFFLGTPKCAKKWLKNAIFRQFFTFSNFIAKNKKVVTARSMILSHDMCPIVV